VSRLPLPAVLAIVLSARGCVAPPAAPTAMVAAPANPVLGRNFPDPAVLRAQDGLYYA